MSAAGDVDAIALEALWDHAPLGIALLDRGGVTLRANAALAAMLGIGRDELVGRRLADHVHEDDREDVVGARELERRYRTAGGAILLVRELRSIVGPRTLVILEDVTERRREADARAAQACLSHLGAMGSVVAHELRNGLAGIGSAVEVIGQAFPVASPERLAVDEVRASVAELSRMVRDLVRVARPRSIRCSPTSARVLLGEVVRALEAGGVTAALEVAGADATLSADAELLASALVQLASDGGQQIRLALEARELALELRIEGARGSARSGGGRGAELGRRVARLIVEAHGGALSIGDDGETVVALPLARPPQGRTE